MIMTTKRKTTKKKVAKPKTKIIYRTRKDSNPLNGVNDMVKTGAGIVITFGVANAVLKALK